MLITVTIIRYIRQCQCLSPFLYPVTLIMYLPDNIPIPMPNRSLGSHWMIKLKVFIGLRGYCQTMLKYRLNWAFFFSFINLIMSETLWLKESFSMGLFDFLRVTTSAPGKARIRNLVDQKALPLHHCAPLLHMIAIHEKMFLAKRTKNNCYRQLVNASVFSWE